MTHFGKRHLWFSRKQKQWALNETEKLTLLQDLYMHILRN